MLRLFLNETLFWSADENEITPNHAIFSLKTQEEVNSIGIMTFTISPNHPRKTELKIRRATFLLADDDNILFVGRLTDIVQNFNFMIDCTVSDMMEALTCCPCQPNYHNAEDDNISTVDSYDSETIVSTLEYFISDNVKFVFQSSQYMTSDWLNNPIRSIQNGYISHPTDYNGNEISAYQSSRIDRMNSIYDVLFNTYLKNSCAIILISYENGYYDSSNKRYESFTAYFNVINDIMKIKLPVGTLGVLECRDAFVFGDNLLEFTRESDSQEKISGILPYQNYQVNNKTHRQGIYNSNIFTDFYIQDSALNSQNGFKIVSVDFSLDEGKSTQANLRSMGEDYLNMKFVAYNANKFSIKGIDHYYLGYYPSSEDISTNNWDYDSEEDDDETVVAPLVDPVVSELPPFEIGNYYIEGRNTGHMPIMIADPVCLHSEPHLINIILPCLSKEIDYFNHANDTYIIGPFIPDDYIDPKIASSN